MCGRSCNMHVGYRPHSLHGCYQLFAPLNTGKGGAIGGRISVLCGQFMGAFELRFSPNDTYSVGVYGEIVINSSPRGGAIGFSTLPNPLSSA
jgi:hypothetical protein